jgi:hypothetical protein
MHSWNCSARLSSGWALSLLITACLQPSGVRADDYETRTVHGWTVFVNERLLQEQPDATELALSLTEEQLAAIVRVVPGDAVAKLREVPLWFNPQYEGQRPRAEYHPGRQWLVENDRNPDMVRGVEFSNVRNFRQETLRMPAFVLHELAHAYHHRVLGHDHAGILAAYARAKEAGIYDRVQRWRGPGKPVTEERAYGMNNDKEYFAEVTEAFFARNDFYPFTRAELREHDPEAERLLLSVWGEPLQPWPAAAKQSEPTGP